MFLENRQIEIIKKAIKDYKFMKEEIEEFIGRTKAKVDFNIIQDFILKFKGTDVTNIVEEKDYGYLDFEYNDVNMCVSYQSEEILKVGSTFEIYDKTTCTYIIEDFLSVEEWENLINTSKETMLEDAIFNLKSYESKGKSYEYEEQLKKIIVFLKENW